MKYLLDTCVLQELLSEEPTQLLINWLVTRANQEIFISAFSLAQLHQGVASLDEVRRGAEITEWLDNVESGFGNHIVPFTANTAQFWTMVTQHDKAKTLSVPDAYIYATAVEHGMCLVTHHTEELAQSVVQYFDPWDPLHAPSRMM